MTLSDYIKSLPGDSQVFAEQLRDDTKRLIVTARSRGITPNVRRMCNRAIAHYLYSIGYCTDEQARRMEQLRIAA